MAFYTFSQHTVQGGASFASDENRVILYGGPCVLWYEGKELARLNISSPTPMALRDFTESVATYFKEPPESSPALCLIEPFGTSGGEYDNARRMLITGVPYTTRLYDFIVIPGRSSRLGQDFVSLFTGRFLKPNANTFLTTRTHLSPLVIKETELAPLYFLKDSQAKSETFELRALENTGVPAITWTLHEPGVYTLDLEKVRRQIFEEYGAVCSIFDVRRDGVFGCRIAIERAEPSIHRHRLKFRNSFGVFEIIELTGELIAEPQIISEEYQRYDFTRAYFERARQRAEYSLQVSISSGMKTPAEIAHLFDALTSDEVYLLDFTPGPLKVIPAAKGFTLPERSEAPQDITLTLTATREEISAMPYASAVMLRRFFTKQYNTKFQ